jgi:hypothetical protein
MTTLYLNSKSLSDLPDIPDNITKLYCTSNELTSLPDLPPNLEELHCQYNYLTSLPKLPQSLRYLNCAYNQLVSLPELPSSLIRLECNNNKLTSLPELPPNLEELHCETNKLKTLPLLPNSLNAIVFSNNPYNQQFLMFLKQFFQSGGPDSFSIPRLREKINNYYTVRNKARNVSSLMQTIGNSEKVTEMGLAPPLPETTARERLPRNTLSRMASFLSGEKGNYRMQQKALREKLTRPDGAPGVGGSMKKSRRQSTKKIRKNRKKTKKSRRTVYY